MPGRGRIRGSETVTTWREEGRGDMSDIAAVVYAGLAVVVIGFQLALALGAPWGEFAMAGRFPGRFPPAMRVSAVFSAFLIAMMAGIVVARAGVALPALAEMSQWAIWIVVAYSVVGLVMNLVTPSKRERALWAPVTAVMLACSVIVALGL